MRTAQVFDPRPARLEPRVVPVEFGPKPGVDAGPAFVRRLVDVDVEHKVIDALRHGPVAAAFERPGGADEERTARECLGGRDRHAVDVRGGRSRAQLDAAQLAGRPELAADVIGLSAVLQELGRKTPVAIVLQPQLQPVLMAHVPQAAHVIHGHAVRHQPPQVPQKAVRLVRAAHDAAGQHRQPAARVVTVTLAEQLAEPVRPILGTHLVAVRHDMLERRPLGRPASASATGR